MNSNSPQSSDTIVASETAPESPEELASTGNYEDLVIEKEEGIVVILSDFHMAEGYLAHKRVFSKTENFFQDESFQALIRYLKTQRAEKQKRITLIINGDFMDFVRVRSVPTEQENQVFQRYLQKLRDNISAGEIHISIDRNEEVFGLYSHEMKSVWKLQRIAAGHSIVMDALAEFLADGNRLIIVKGNHDLEFYWPRVQDEFRKLLAMRLPAADGVYKHALEQMDFMRRNVLFVQRAVIIEHTIYIEHGHQFEPITRVSGPPVRNGQIALPAGSILNRYLINALETIAPFINNIRPMSEIFKTLTFKQKLQALWVLLRHLPIASRMMLQHYRKYWVVLFLEILPYILMLLYAVFGMLLPVLSQNYAEFYYSLTGDAGRYLVKNWLLNLVLAFVVFEGLKRLAHFLGRNHFFRLKEALDTAKRRIGPAPAKVKNRFLVLSHTHKARVKCLGDGWWYINTGTWIPVIDLREILMHDKFTLSFVCFEKKSLGEWDFQLMRWSDSKNRAERLILLED